MRIVRKSNKPKKQQNDKQFIAPQFGKVENKQDNTVIVTEQNSPVNSKTKRNRFSRGRKRTRTAKPSYKPVHIDLLYKHLHPVQKFIAFDDVTEDGIIVTPFHQKSRSLDLARLFGTGAEPVNKKMKTYTVVIKFEDFNYQLYSDENKKEVLSKYAQFLNFFDSTLNMQVLIVNTPADKDKLAQSLVTQNGNYPEYSEDYNKVVSNVIHESGDIYIQEKYLAISTTIDNYATAQKILHKVVDDVVAHMQSMGSVTHVLSREEVVKLMHDLFLYKEPFAYSPLETVKDIVSPSSILFKRDHAIVDENQFVSFLYIKVYPPILSDQILYKILSSEIKCTVSIHLHSLPQQVSETLARRALMNQEGASMDAQKDALRSGIAGYVPYKIQKAIQEIKQTIDDLQDRGMRLFETTIIVTVYGNSEEEIKLNRDKVTRIMAEYSGIMSPLNAYQENAWNSVYPLAVNYIPEDRLLNTANISTFIPFTAKNYLDPEGFYYGVNLITNVPIIFDRRKLRNPNGFILGTPGSGKSFAAKREISEILLNTDDDVIVIDPEREYQALAKAFNGTDIEISNSSPNHINPMDISEFYADVSEEDPISFKSEAIMAMFGAVLKDITNVQRSLLDRAVRFTYSEAKRKKKVPTLEDLYTELHGASQPEAKYLALEIELYVKGSLSVFAHPTNINVQNRFIVYDIRDLGPELKTFGMFVVLDQIWNRITANRQNKKRTWVYIDEIYLLFQNVYAQDFLFKMFKRSRKWGAIITGITQNVEDLMHSDQARTMLANTDFMMLFNQAPTDRILLQKLLHLSPSEVNYFSSAPAGQALMSIDHVFIPARDKFPVSSKLYKAMTTKFGEA
jgi:hypothetical protein